MFPYPSNGKTMKSESGIHTNKDQRVIKPLRMKIYKEKEDSKYK